MHYVINYFSTLLLLDIFAFDIILIFASFLQTYFDIYFFHILSFSLYLLQISFFIYFLLAPLAFFYHFHSNLLLYLALFLCFFDNKLYYPFSYNEKKIIIFFLLINPHMHEIFLQRYCMKWVPGDPLKEMIN